MIERRHNEYGLRGVMWVAKKIGGRDAAVIAKTKVNRWGVFAIVGGDLYLRKEFYDYGAAQSFAETLIP